MDTRTICLGVLSLYDATGYKIKKQFEEGPFSYFFDAGFGSIYPALNKMLSDELVTCVEVPQDGRPAKKVYSITDAGRAELRTALHDQPAKDKLRSESLVMMFFGHLLEPDQRKRVYEFQLNYYRDGLDCLYEADLSKAEYDHRFVHGLGKAVYEAAIRYLEAHEEDFLYGDDAPVAKRAAGGGR